MFPVLGGISRKENKSSVVTFVPQWDRLNKFFVRFDPRFKSKFFVVLSSGCHF